ncbi:hypothetical protein KCU93_g10194, partial [Aureobasidium melanogenum]
MIAHASKNMLAIKYGPDQNVDEYLQEEYLGGILLPYPAPHSQIPQPNFTEDSNTNNSALSGLSSDFEQNQRRFHLDISPELAVSELTGGSMNSCVDHAEDVTTLAPDWNDKAVDMIGNAGPIYSPYHDQSSLSDHNEGHHNLGLSWSEQRPVFSCNILPQRRSVCGPHYQNEYLREARRHGLSYKDIKHRGHSTEAESTLRGRYRILSKPKEMRVRNPQWNYSDIMLLVKAVGLFSSTVIVLEKRPRAPTCVPSIFSS